MPRDRRDGSVLIPQRFGPGAFAEWIAAWKAVRDLPEMPSSVRRWAKFLLEELGVNIVQHSGAPQTGFGMARGEARERHFQIAFADAGQGFFNSVQRNLEFAGRVQDDGEALQLALKE